MRRPQNQASIVTRQSILKATPKPRQTNPHNRMPPDHQRRQNEKHPDPNQTPPVWTRNIQHRMVNQHTRQGRPQKKTQSRRKHPKNLRKNPRRPLRHVNRQSRNITCQVTHRSSRLQHQRNVRELRPESQRAPTPKNDALRCHVFPQLCLTLSRPPTKPRKWPQPNLMPPS